MNPEQQEIWKNEALGALFEAFALHAPLADRLIYKGARVLALHLGHGRQSLDIDATVTMSFSGADTDTQSSFFAREITRAANRYFERQDPVRYQLEGVRVIKKQHPRGWDSLKVRLNLEDTRWPGVRGMPLLEVDISAKEDLLPSSVVERQVGSGWIRAYTLERIAGEKLRAFLSTLPTYRSKANKPGEAIRVRDLYDLAKILKDRPAERTDFWKTVSEEFVVACRSRAVDCHGLSSFMEDWGETERAYNESGILPNDVSFAEAENALRTIVKLLERNVSFPLVYALPPRVDR